MRQHPDLLYGGGQQVARLQGFLSRATLGESQGNTEGTSNRCGGVLSGKG